MKLPRARRAPALACAMACAAVTAAAADNPNVLLIMADDLGYECVRANGGTYETPHLDALADAGMRFTRAHAQPLCTPSRVQLMTGLYNSRNYLRFGQLDPEARTFAHHLKAAGYGTAVAGKWQLDGGAQAPAHFGFDTWCLWQVTDRPERYWGPGLEEDGEKVDYPDDVFGPDVATDFLCAFMEANRGRPFFAYYPMILPHDPFVPTPANVGDRPEKWKHTTENFAGFVSYTDTLVGRLVAKLDELGLREDTLVNFTGDNGTHGSVTSELDGEPYRGGKGKLSRNGTHVPFVASWPGKVPAGQTTDSLVDLSDIFPTLAELAGAPLPPDHLTDGISMVPVLTGTDGPRRQWSYCWYERGGDRSKANPFVHNHDFKLNSKGRFVDLRQGWDKPVVVEEPSGPVYEMLRDALAAQNAVAEACAPSVEARRAAVPPPTYQRKTRG